MKKLRMRRTPVTKNIKPTHITEKVILTKRSIENFELLENPRNLRPAQLGKLSQMLLRGEHFESHMIVNKTINGKYRVIDGNHRLMAMKNFFKQHPDATIEIKMDVFKGLTIAEEKEKFTSYNLGMRQTPTDWMKVHKNDIPIIQILEDYKDVKITLYPTPKSVPMVVLLKAYIGIWTQKVASQTRSNNVKLIEWYKRLDNKDARFIKRVLLRIKSVTGVEGKDNIWLQAPFLAPIMRIVHDNPEQEEEFWQVFGKKIVFDPDLLGRGRTSSSNANQELNGKRMLEILNTRKRGNSPNMFEITDNSSTRDAFEQLKKD